ncbi:TorF family putative porin [Falsiroseomonas sp.]|uniref:TorF family putative porin n=1 Tax=Falsiroseomonas sp. TaxID=2870721 RepID=UPI00272CCB9A|nr:TorF family putative porin [Falsiroseomonas sp.]
MIRSSTLAISALICGILGNPGAVSAQQTIESAGLTIATTPAVTSDYVFRGLSQTRNRPAAQLTLDVEHTSGLYVGAFLSNVAFAGTNARQELDLNAGYRMEVAGVKLDLGATYYAYPGYDAPTGGYELNFYEFALRASYEVAPVKFVGLAAISPNFTGESGLGVYLEGGFDMALDFGFTIGGRVGYQWVERNFARAGRNEGAFGADDYLNVSLFASREIVGGVIGTLSAVFTSLDPRADCFGGAKVCDDRVVFTLSRPF